MTGVRRMSTASIASDIRSLAASWTLRNNGGYLAQACGSAEIFATLYSEVLNLGPSTGDLKPPRFSGVPTIAHSAQRGEDWLGNGPDLFVVSPAHYGTAQFCALAAIGRLDSNFFAEESSDGGLLELIPGEHSPGMTVTSGSLATALGVTVGRAIARRSQGKNGFLWVLLSDGELQEGATWESAQLANAENLENLKVLVDVNGMQVDGPMAEIMPIGSPAEKFKAFGWHTFDIDGHDISAIAQACDEAKKIKGPVAIICHTQPWRGFGFLEERWKLHKLHFVRLTEIEKTELTDAVQS
jgi:transketolase